METVKYRAKADSGHCETKLEKEETAKITIEEPQTSTLETSHFIYYLKFFINLGYVLFIIPFRIKLIYDPASYEKRYKLFSNKFQKIICCIIQSIVIFELLSILRLLPSFKKMQENPLNILHCLNTVASLIYTVSLLYIFWWKKEKLEGICEQLQDRNCLPVVERSNKWTKKQVKLLAYVVCIGAYLTAMTHPVTHDIFVFESNSSFFERMFVQAKVCFLLGSPHDEEHHLHFHSWRSIPTFLLTCVHIIVLIPSAALVHMLDLFALLMTICCWDVMKNFTRKTIECHDKFLQGSTEHLPTVILQYQALKRFFKTVNSGVGLLYLCCIGISLPIYATWIAVQFFNNEKVETYDAIHFYIYFATFLLVLSMAARINQRVIIVANEFYDWVGSSNLRNQLSPNEMTVLMMDLYSNKISLTGCGIFAINFRFLVTILGIIVTYTSIIVQFQITRGDNSQTHFLLENATNS